MQSPDLPLEPALQPLASLLPSGRPFTSAMAAEVGVDRRALARMLRDGVLRRLLRGVYVDTTVADSPELRRAAAGLVAGPGRVVTGRSAAWLHGVTVPGWSDGQHLEVRARRARPLPARDVTELGEVRVTTPVRTTLDLGRLLTPEQAIGALDAILRAGLVHHRELLAEVPRMGRLPGAAQLRRVVALADGRSGCLAESVLRMRWYDAALPTPIPRLALGGELWLELAVPVRRFAVVLAGRLTDVELAALRSRGWRVVVLGEARVLSAEPALVIHHLEREYHQHLLDQVG